MKFRPEQIVVGSMASQLNLRQQHLCIRVFKCENLPIADAEEGTSDPLVRVLWDGIMRARGLWPEEGALFCFKIRARREKVLINHGHTEDFQANLRNYQNSQSRMFFQ